MEDKQTSVAFVVGSHCLHVADPIVSRMLCYRALVCDSRFREAPVEIPSIIAKFACVCSINNRDFPQGTGKTKKDAKTEAARNAFMIMLGIDDDAQGEGAVEPFDLQSLHWTTVSFAVRIFSKISIKQD